MTEPDPLTSSATSNGFCASSPASSITHASALPDLALVMVTARAPGRTLFAYQISEVTGAGGGVETELRVPVHTYTFPASSLIEGGSFPPVRPTTRVLPAVV